MYNSTLKFTHSIVKEHGKEHIMQQTVHHDADTNRKAFTNNLHRGPQDLNYLLLIVHHCVGVITLLSLGSIKKY